MSIIIRKHNFYNQAIFRENHHYYNPNANIADKDNEFDYFPSIEPVIRFDNLLQASGNSLSTCYTGTISSSGTYDNLVASGDGKHFIRYGNNRILDWIPVVDIQCDKPPQSGCVLADFYLQPSWDGGIEQASASGNEYMYTQYIGSVFSNTFPVNNDDFRNDYRLNFHNNILPKIKTMDNFAIRVFNRSTTAISVNIKLLPSFVEITNE